MAGGGGSSSPNVSFVQQQSQFQPLPESNIQANMGPQFGPTATPNPYVAGNAPDWATGHFAMPWWGLDPFGQPLSQEQMMYQAPAPAQAQAPAMSPAQAAQNTFNEQLAAQERYDNWKAGQAAYQALEMAQERANAGSKEFGLGIGGWNPSPPADTRYMMQNEWAYKPKDQWSLYDKAQAEAHTVRR